MLKMSQLRNEKGFTLIELLIVIVVLGILAAIVLFAVGSARDDAEESACQADYKTLQTALEARKAKEGTYANETTLVSEDFLTDPSDKYNVLGTDGVITVQGTSGCLTSSPWA